MMYKKELLKDRYFCISLFLLMLAFYGWPLGCHGQNTGQLIVCGDDLVTIFDLHQSQDTIPKIIWEWRASAAQDLPKNYRKSYFNSIDECKCIDDGQRLLITSSSSGVALLDRPTKKVLFYATVGNAHSAAALPNNRIAVMGSTNEKGNRIAIFDLGASEEVLFYDSIYSGHGAVWDPERKLLYALGYDELRAYELVKWDTKSPEMSLVHAWSIPGESGHDLSPWVGNDDKLILTEHNGAWVFDQKSHRFEPFESLAKTPDVKAISVEPKTGQIAYIKAETSWWSERVYLLNSDQYFSFPGRHLYKVRWLEGR